MLAAWHEQLSTPPATAREFGVYGEELVTQHLQRYGYTIMARNYRQQYGEIDIIAGKSELLLFVEVKARVASVFGTDHLVPPAKQRKLAMVAREFMVRHDVVDKVCRFDVAVVERQGCAVNISYIENAFVGDE